MQSAGRVNLVNTEDVTAVGSEFEDMAALLVDVAGAEGAIEATLEWKRCGFESSSTKMIAVLENVGS